MKKSKAIGGMPLFFILLGGRQIFYQPFGGTQIRKGWEPLVWIMLESTIIGFYYSKINLTYLTLPNLIKF
jgi:hypothetical protein